MITHFFSDDDILEVLGQVSTHLSNTGYLPGLDVELWMPENLSVLWDGEPENIAACIPKHDASEPLHRAAFANWIAHVPTDYGWGTRVEEAYKSAQRRALRDYLSSALPRSPTLPILRWELHAAAVARHVDRVVALGALWERYDPDLLHLHRVARALFTLTTETPHDDFPDWAWDFDISPDSEAEGLELVWDTIATAQACAAEKVEILWESTYPAGDPHRELPLICRSMLERLGPTRLEANPVASAIAAWCDCSVGHIEQRDDHLLRAGVGYSALAKRSDMPDPVLRRMALRAAVGCYTKAQDFVSAERIAHEWIELEPSSPEAHNQLAQCFYKQSLFPECFDALETSLRLNEADDDDWKSSFLLKLGLESRNRRLVTQAIENTAFISQFRPQGEALVRWVSPWTSRLCQAAADRWWVGMYSLTNATLKQEIGEASAREQAGAALGEAVNLQLRDSVARPFAEELSAAPLHGSPDKHWAQFIQSKATIGEQLSCLLQTRHPNNEPAKRLQTWLGRHAPRLTEHLHKKGSGLMTLALLRGDAQHNTISQDQLRILYEEAAALLDVVVR